MSNGADPNSPQFVQSLVQGVVTENYINFAVLAVLLYDMVAYLEEEVKYFWAKPRAAVSVLYFVNRYGAIIATALEILLNALNVNETTCRMLYVRDILFTITLICVDYILFLRVNALYSQGRMIKRVLISLFGLEALAGIGIAIHAAFLADPISSEMDGLSLCTVTNPSSAEGVLSWCIPLAYNTLLMVLALYKAGQIWKESAGFKGLNLLKILIRDQVFYFLAINVVCIANILSISVELNSFWGFVLSAVGDSGLLSIVGSRLLFNMKEAGERGLNQGTSYSLKSVKSSINFAAPSGAVEESSLGRPTESVEAELEGNA